MDFRPCVIFLDKDSFETETVEITPEHTFFSVSRNWNTVLYWLDENRLLTPSPLQRGKFI